MLYSSQPRLLNREYEEALMLLTVFDPQYCIGDYFSEGNFNYLSGGPSERLIDLPTALVAMMLTPFHEVAPENLPPAIRALQFHF
jgi:hypothetical protein